MTRINLLCKDKCYARTEWLLDLTDDGGQLVDPAGVVQAQFTHAEAEGRFVFPSFWKSISDLGIIADDGTTILFQPQRDRVADLKRYLANALAAQGPEEVRRQRVIAWLKIAGGSVLVLAAAPCAFSVYAILDALEITRVTRLVNNRRHRAFDCGRGFAGQRPGRPAAIAPGGR